MVEGIQGKGLWVKREGKGPAVLKEVRIGQPVQ